MVAVKLYHLHGIVSHGQFSKSAQKEISSQKVLRKKFLRKNKTGKWDNKPEINRQKTDSSCLIMKHLNWLTVCTLPPNPHPLWMRAALWCTGWSCSASPPAEADSGTGCTIPNHFEVAPCPPRRWRWHLQSERSVPVEWMPRVLHFSSKIQGRK